MEEQRIYSRRFNPDLKFRNEMWRILCRDFFQKYIDPDSRILEIGAGYCEFINQIQAAEKTALELNPDVRSYAAADVRIIQERSSRMSAVSDHSVEVVFASNFFEHLSREEILATFREVYRVLVPGGKFMVLQPNIRFSGKDYWMFFDHLTPIDDRAFVEALEICGFELQELITRFLPFTTKTRLPRSPFLIRMYLRLRMVWPLFGQQSFILSRKPK
jgi:SAM-dependent methyltransferase